MKTNIIKCIAILMLLCLLPTRMWADESFEGSFAWDLTTDSYQSSSTTEVLWEHGNIARMILSRFNSSTSANSKLGGSTNNFTKLSPNQKLSILPLENKTIEQIIITTDKATERYDWAQNLYEGNWYNATRTFSQNQVSIIPIEKNKAVDVTLTAAVQATYVRVIYSSSITYTRTGLQAGDYATMCLPFGSTDFTGAEFYNIAGVTKSGDEITGIALESVSVLEAGKPYIFKATDTQQVINLSGACQETPVAATGLVGNLSETAIVVNKDDNAYIIGTDNKIHLITDDATAKIKQYRAYIKLDDVPEASSESPARLDIFDASAIHNITNDADQQQEIFDLQGRKLTTPQQGLNVIDGKKVIINK